MKFKNGELYYIKFLDHCISEDHTVIECEVCGWVLSEDKDRVTLTWWHVSNDAYRDGNDEPVSIIKSTIKKKRNIRL